MTTPRAAVEADFPRLQAIEVEAGAPFRAIGMHAIADMPPPSTEVLQAYVDDGHCWVIGDIAGYLLADVVDGCAHIAQVSVAPEFRGKRFGRELIDHLDRWAIGQGLAALTLTTFRDVPWNGPYYARLGFRVIEPTPELAEMVAHEANVGLDPATRVCMRRDL
jgi:GNAT superfamily N-acetyltransferase